MKKLRHREVQYLAQGHITGKLELGLQAVRPQRQFQYIIYFPITLNVPYFIIGQFRMLHLEGGGECPVLGHLAWHWIPVPTDPLANGHPYPFRPPNVACFFIVSRACPDENHLVFTVRPKTHCAQEASSGLALVHLWLPGHSVSLQWPLHLPFLIIILFDLV